MTLAAAHLSDGCIKGASLLSAAVEFIHTATLLHDDVIDESALRRGAATANALWGNSASVLVGDFLFSRAFQLMVKVGNLKVLEVLSNTSALISQGEVMQLCEQGNLDITKARYLEIIEHKTASLFSASCYAGALLTNAPNPKGQRLAEALKSFGTNYGLGFQIIDDILDYQGSNDTIGKCPGDDLREQKVTLPVIYAYTSSTPCEQRFWQRVFTPKLEVLKNESFDGGVLQNKAEQNFQEAKGLIEKYDGFSKAYEHAIDHGNKARQALANIEEQTSERKHDLINILHRFLDYSIKRTS